MAPLDSAALAALHSLDGAAELRVYEGLPHRRDEGELFELENARVKAVEFINDRFYPNPLLMEPADLAQLKEIASRPGWFEVIGFRACDGREMFGEIRMCLFHADYAVEWVADGQTRRILFCFGCGEAVFFDPTFELTSYTAVVPELRKLMLGYQRQRPSSAAWPPKA